MSVILDGQTLTIADVERVAVRRAGVSLDASVPMRLERSRAVIEAALRSGETIYGVNTGFGQLKNRVIPPADIARLQENLILSHAAGVGPALPEPVCRAMLLLRTQALLAGHSGVRPELVGLMLQMLNHGVTPVIPSQGSVGASGDLIPLAHLAWTVIGGGEAWYEGERMHSQAALDKAGLAPIQLAAREGLALINGTQAMTAIGSLAVARAERLADICDLAAAMSLEALLGSVQPYRADVHRLRPHAGQQIVAANVRALTRHSELIPSHAACGQLQDAYSLRCVPQVHGAGRDALTQIKAVLSIEINSVTDNPLVFPETNEVISAGQFHGHPVAIWMDFLKIALSGWANISERRTERLVNPHLSNGLPAFLIREGGLNSGLMLAQYAAASLVSENKVLAHPASVDSIPTSASQEDYVSMGTTAARHAMTILEHAETVLAIEVLCATQALDLQQPLRPGTGVGKAHACVRDVVPHLDRDRPLTGDIESVRQLIVGGELHHVIQPYLHGHERHS
ncbi:MAG: histidine ammonia-lyase [Candidatus Sericytochromatia bacterium]|nr:histidine ammonia-lyase [Candidatus Sericytochromatia bacterium]